MRRRAAADERESGAFSRRPEVLRGCFPVISRRAGLGLGALRAAGGAASREGLSVRGGAVKWVVYRAFSRLISHNGPRTGLGSKRSSRA